MLKDKKLEDVTLKKISILCEDCGKERIVSNLVISKIKKGLSKNKCRSCIQKDSMNRLDVKEKQRIAHSGKHYSPNTEFKKGNTSWLKGTKGLIKSNSGSFKKGSIPWSRGKKLSDELKSKISIATKKAMKEDKIRLKLRKSKLGKTYEEMYGIEDAMKRKLNYKEKMKNYVRPKLDTSIELKIQEFLKLLNIPFEKHKYITNIDHSYPCDIYIKPNLIIECDGDYWHGNIEKYPILNKFQIKQMEEDNLRNNELNDKGYKIIRLWGSEIKKMNISDFKRIIGPTLRETIEISNQSNNMVFQGKGNGEVSLVLEYIQILPSTFHNGVENTSFPSGDC